MEGGWTRGWVIRVRGEVGFAREEREVREGVCWRRTTRRIGAGRAYAMRRNNMRPGDACLSIKFAPIRQGTTME